MQTRQPKELPSLLKLATPLAFSLLAQFAQDLTDTIMMGDLGVNNLAAGILSWHALWLLLVFFMGIINAVGINIAQALGAMQTQHINPIFQQGIYLCLFMTPLFMLAVWLLPDFFAAIHQPAVLVNLSRAFLQHIIWGVPALIGFFLLRDYVTPLHYPRIIMYASIVAVPINILLNYVFMYGKLGLPAMHIAGIGLASAIVMWLNFFLVLFYIMKHHALKQHFLVALAKPNWQQIRLILQVGCPIGMTIVLEDGLFVATTLLMSYVSITALAAYQIVIQCYSLSFMITLALGQATSVRVAYHVGAKNVAGVKRVVIFGLLLSLIVAVFFSLFYLIMPETLTDMYIDIHTPNEAGLLALSKSFFLFAIVLSAFDGFQIITNHALRGMKDTLLPMFLSMGSYWLLGLGCGALLAFYWGYGSNGLWAGLIIGVVVSSIFLLLRFRYKLRYDTNALLTTS